MANPQPSDDELREWHRRFAVNSNNRAWELAESPSRSRVEDAEMLNAAHSAAYHWSQAGTDLQVARAEMLLGQVYALLGQGELAMHYATASFGYFSSHETENWELAFAHAVLANAASAAKMTEMHSRHYQLAEVIGHDPLTAPEDREVFDATSRQIPTPEQND